jgi:hypothetical protein
MPPQHLRQVERRAEALRRRADRPDRHALRAANLDDGGGRRGQAFVRDTLRFFEVDAHLLLQAQGRHRDGYLVPYQIYKAQTVKTAAEVASR